MEAVYYAARANLRRLMRLHPDWKQSQSVQATGMSLGWVKQWKKRLQEAPADDEQILQGRSRARKHPPERISAVGVDRILDIRDQPPEGLGRTPGRHPRSRTSCRAIANWLLKGSACPGRVAPSSASCGKPDASGSGCHTCRTRSSVRHP